MSDNQVAILGVGAIEKRASSPPSASLTMASKRKASSAGSGKASLNPASGAAAPSTVAGAASGEPGSAADVGDGNPAGPPGRTAAGSAAAAGGSTRSRSVRCGG